MGIFTNSTNIMPAAPLKPGMCDSVPWRGETGSVLKGNTRFSIKGLPSTAYEARQLQAVHCKYAKAAIFQDKVSGSSFSLDYQHVADAECEGQIPHIKLIQGFDCLFELAVHDGYMEVFKGTTPSEFNGKEKLGRMDMNKGFFTDEFSVISVGEEAPCVVCDSKSFLDPVQEYKNAQGEVVARQHGIDAIEIAEGVDVLKIFAVFSVRWWNYVNEKCGPVGELPQGGKGVV